MACKAQSTWLSRKLSASLKEVYTGRVTITPSARANIRMLRDCRNLRSVTVPK
jgi:hypothetical protein